ncbi:MAG: Fe-S-containing hydro-lyase [Nitrospiraceae bacterium]|nr:Fe-S-containing hydro-lyase [Nitrospiraceae bacterium]
MSREITLQTPLSDSDTAPLRIGDRVLLSGIVYTARDAAHKRLVDLMDSGKTLPFDLKGAVIYYVGPAPAPPGKPIGSAGPTTSYRMDAFAPRLIAAGLKGMIGKGARASTVIEAIKTFKAIYFGAIGGSGALIAQSIVASEIIAYEDLGPEAIRRLEVKNLPLFVVNDTYGSDLYEEGVKKYAE